MASLLAFVLRPWRTLHQTLGTCSLALALGLGGAALTTPSAAVAAPTRAAATTLAPRSRPKASKAAKKSAARKSARTSAKRASGKARRTASRAERRAIARRRGRTGRTERPAPRPSADLLSADDVAVPQVALPELALASAAPGTGGVATLRLITRSASSLLDGLLTRARGQLGTRYVYGGADPDNALDCSSFARYVMEALNVRLPRTANQQARVGTPVPRDLTALRPGDLLTFGSPRRTSHVGIYLGEGRFIHASVKSGQVIETTIERNRSLFRRWQGARRLLAGVLDTLPDAADQGVAAESGAGAGG